MRKLQTNGLRDTVMSRLRRVNYMCSSTVSDPANRLLKRTDSEGSSSVAEKKSSAVPLFEAVTGLWSAPDSLRERGDSQEGGNRRCLPSCAPARRQRTFPLDSSEKPAARQGHIADAARVPRSPGAERRCRPDRVNRLRGSGAPVNRCREAAARTGRIADATRVP